MKHKIAPTSSQALHLVLSLFALSLFSSSARAFEYKLSLPKTTLGNSGLSKDPGGVGGEGDSQGPPMMCEVDPNSEQNQEGAESGQGDSASAAPASQGSGGEGASAEGNNVSFAQGENGCGPGKIPSQANSANQEAVQGADAASSAAQSVDNAVDSSQRADVQNSLNEMGQNLETLNQEMDAAGLDSSDHQAVSQMLSERVAQTDSQDFDEDNQVAFGNSSPQAFQSAVEEAKKAIEGFQSFEGQGAVPAQFDRNPGAAAYDMYQREAEATQIASDNFEAQQQRGLSGLSPERIDFGGADPQGANQLLQANSIGQGEIDPLSNSKQAVERNLTASGEVANLNDKALPLGNQASDRALLREELAALTQRLSPTINNIVGGARVVANATSQSASETSNRNLLDVKANAESSKGVRSVSAGSSKSSEGSGRELASKRAPRDRSRFLKKNTRRPDQRSKEILKSLGYQTDFAEKTPASLPVKAVRNAGQFQDNDSSQLALTAFFNTLGDDSEWQVGGKTIYVPMLWKWIFPLILILVAWMWSQRNVRLKKLLSMHSISTISDANRFRDYSTQPEGLKQTQPAPSSSFLPNQNYFMFDMDRAKWVMVTTDHTGVISAPVGEVLQGTVTMGSAIGASEPLEYYQLSENGKWEIAKSKEDAYRIEFY